MKPSDLILNITTPENFSVMTALRSARDSKDADALEDALLYCCELGYPQECLPVLNDLITQGWHYSHEEIARILQKFADPSSIDAVARAAELDLDYLSYNNGYALIKKCCWVLTAIGTDEANAKLSELSASKNEIVAEQASHRLARIKEV